jgi:hypothetical protein
MYHNDLARTGQNLSETQLTPADVNSTSFGRLFSVPVDGQVYAQPLYMSGLTIPGQGVHNVVFVATQHDSVYAFDADTNIGPEVNPLWHDSFINPPTGVTTVLSADVNCYDIAPEIGITATPVIDPASNTLYVVAMTKEISGDTTTYVHRLHALDVATGAEKFGGPVVIQASATGTGDGGTVDVFNPHDFKERPALLLSGGVVYTAWSSHCDESAYHGWLIGYDAHTLQQVSVFNVTPNGQLGSIWASGAGPAVDAQGDIYFTTANGTFDANSGGSDYGNTFLRLQANGAGGMSVVQYFTPFNQAMLNAQDLDLGSGGVLLLPDAVGSTAHPHLLTSAGKQGEIYLVDRDTMGGFNNGSDQVVQELASSPEFGMAAYFNGDLYYGGDGDSLKAFSVANAGLSTAPASQSSTVFGFPGTTPSVSANGTMNAIVWAIENGSGGAVLHAYDAGNLADELYNSGEAGTRDQLDAAVKFTVPTIADGHVFVGTNAMLTVFGMFSNHLTATGADAGGGPEVKVFAGPARSLKFEFYAYDPGFTGGVRVAVGDVNGDGVPDIVTAPGPGGGPDVRVFDGRTGAMIREFMAYDPGFLGGVFVAVGDVNHDGYADIITGADAGGGPHVKVFSGKDGSVLYSFMAYAPAFTGGVRVAAADLNGDGFADIITGAGPGGGPHVQAFSGRDLSLLQSFMAYAPAFTGGVYVAAADVNADGFADIITGAGPGGGPHVKVFSGQDGSVLESYMAYDPAFTGGVRVGAGDILGDGRAEILSAAGPGGLPLVQVFNAVPLFVLDDYFAYSSGFVGGVFIGGSQTG